MIFDQSKALEKKMLLSMLYHDEQVRQWSIAQFYNMKQARNNG